MASSDLIFDKQHKRRVEAIIANLKKLYDEATARFTGLSEKVDYDGSKIFSFSDFPNLRKEAEKTVKDLSLGIQQIVMRGTSSEWENGSVAADSVVGRLLKTIGMSSNDLTGEAKKIYFDHNQGALKAFQQRKLGSGDTISQRIWDISKQHKLENELAISVAHGTSADETAKTIQNLLKEPDKLYRRVRDEYGELQLSKHARQYSPGAGMYRSSYKNAMRLARTEINMSYRNAEIESYKDKDYIVGYEVHRSTHDYDCDLCEDLKGKYPKNFQFNGWHPNCRCFITPILISEEEMAARREAILNGEEFDTSKSKNVVTDVPEGFKEWVSENTDRIEASADKGTLPYFIRDNIGYVAQSADVKDAGEVVNIISQAARSNGEMSITDISAILGAKPDIITEDVFCIEPGVYTGEREQLHKSIVSRYIAGHTTKSDTVYMLGGAPANGKSTLVDSGLLKHPAGSLVIDADKVKAMIPEYSSMVDSMDKYLVKAAANFVHEESSLLGKTIQKEAFGKDLSVVIDGVNDGSFAKVEKNVDRIKSLTGGKRVRADYVTLDADLSMKLASARSAKTGREVPARVILEGNKGIADVVPQLIEHKTFDELFLWDTNINGKPRLILKQIDGELEIVEPELYKAFLKKQSIAIPK